MAMWLHISAKNKTNVLQEGLPADSQDGAGFTKHGWQSEPHSPNTNIMCKRWDTLQSSAAGPAARTSCLGKPSCWPRLLQRLVRPVRGESSITGLRRPPAVNHA